MKTKKVNQQINSCHEFADTSTNFTRKIIDTSVAGIMLTCQAGCQSCTPTSISTTSDSGFNQKNSDVEEVEINTDNQISSVSKPQLKAEAIEEVNMLKIAQEINKPFKNHAGRIMDSAEVQLSKQDYEQTLDCVGTYTSNSGASDQAEYINKFLDHTSTHYGEQATTQILRACGYNCIDEYTISAAKECYSEAKDMNEFLEKLNAKGIGGGHLRFEGKHIIATYDQCYCSLGNQKDKLPGCYCQCSCGWFEKLFVEVMGKPVNVSIKESVILGQQHCTFDILIEEL